ncbi:MAG: F0F1 ATP synthase subunit alpha, partial [Microthrixaceae bacterium]|nr:F0F1 ATP synthase subunit alpha [Microthrixaceae bacterium]
LDALSKQQLERGYRLTELLKQGINSPMSVEEQSVVIYAGTRGYLDNIQVSSVARFESELLEWFRTRHSSVLEDIRTTGAIPDEEAFDAAIKAFAQQFSDESQDQGAPDIEAQGDEDLTVKRSEIHLPESESHREDA